MIKRVQIKNFKCYGDPGVDFTLKRVNFIFGDNSAGKSTFLQLLRMYFQDLNESRSVNGESRFLLDWNFRQYVFKKDAKRSIKLRVTTFNDDDHKEGRDEVYRIYDFISKEGKTIQRYTGDLNHFDVIQGNLSSFHLANKDSALAFESGDGFIPTNVIHSEAPRPTNFKNQQSKTSLNKIALSSLKSEEIDYVNRFFEQLNLPYKCLDAQTLIDRELEVEVDRSNVGAGIDGLFATAVNLYKWRSSSPFSLLELEEPESHLNECQISPLVDFLFKEVADAPRGQVIVECHSELLLLKAMKLIRSKTTKIQAKDVQVLFAQKGPEGTKIVECDIDEAGNVYNWPDKNGFFPARDSIIFGD